MSKRSGFYPCPTVDVARAKVVSQAGGLLTETVRAVGMYRHLATALCPGAAAERGARPSDRSCSTSRSARTAGRRCTAARRTRPRRPRGLRPRRVRDGRPARQPTRSPRCGRSTARTAARAASRQLAGQQAPTMASTPARRSRVVASHAGVDDSPRLTGSLRRTRLGSMREAFALQFLNVDADGPLVSSRPVIGSRTTSLLRSSPRRPSCARRRRLRQGLPKTLLGYLQAR